MAKDKTVHRDFIENGYQPIMGERGGYSPSNEGAQDDLSSLPAGGTAQSQGGGVQENSQGVAKKADAQQR